MTKLADAIAALHRQDYDAVLTGSKYKNEVKFGTSWGFDFKAVDNKTLLRWEAKQNAAKVIVLEQAVKALREGLKRYVLMDKQLNKLLDMDYEPTQIIALLAATEGLVA